MIEKKDNNSKNLDVLIVDGYVDEPSLLGVPPYISTEPRLLAGLAEQEDLNWDYITADEYREKGLPESNKILVHGGVTVPGKYLSGTPLKPEEAERIAAKPNETYLGGPLAKYYNINGFDHYSTMDLSAYFYESLRGKKKDRYATLNERNHWLKKGAKVVKKHPMYPDPLIAEISLYRGCTRYFTGGCSFCSEPMYGKPRFRDQIDIIEEIKKLYDNGIKNFRIGGQSCTISYKANKVGIEDPPKPQPSELKSLFKGIWKKCPKIKVLHLDNANPSIMAKYPDLTKKILNTLVKYTTSGNVLALGMETADPIVIKKNNLNSNPKEVKKAIKLINKTGKERGENGMPKLLPGINFLGGLKGERAKTYKLNYQFLQEIKNSKLWVRRINIRQVLSHQKEFDLQYKKEFKKFKKKVQEKIDQPMLKKMLPPGTVLKDVYMEKKDGNKTFGRQIGTYPLLIGIKYPLELKKYYNIAITDYGYRSVTGIEYPINISNVSFQQLKSIPGIGKRRAAKIFTKKPKNEKEFLNIFSDSKIGKSILKYVSFEK